VEVIRLGTSADLRGATNVYRRAALSIAGDQLNLLANPDLLILSPQALAEERTYVAEEDGTVVGFASWAEANGTVELEDLFVDPGDMRRGIATALVSRVADTLRARGVKNLEVTANLHALGFYRAVGFTDYAAAETRFGPAPRMALPICSLQLTPPGNGTATRATPHREGQ
jgi:ribosomal protein S18 acetylase RimI-like enzyme